MEGQIKCFPDQVKLNEFIITEPLYGMLKGLKKKKIKTMNNKMTIHIESKKQTKQTRRAETESWVQRVF